MVYDFAVVAVVAERPVLFCGVKSIVNILPHILINDFNWFKVKYTISKCI